MGSVVKSMMDRKLATYILLVIIACTAVGGITYYASYWDGHADGWNTAMEYTIMEQLEKNMWKSKYEVTYEAFNAVNEGNKAIVELYSLEVERVMALETIILEKDMQYDNLMEMYKQLENNYISIEENYHNSAEQWTIYRRLYLQEIDRLRHFLNSAEEIYQYFIDRGYIIYVDPEYGSWSIIDLTGVQTSRDE